MDQFPMYGGYDRNSEPVLKAADEQLIEGTSKAFGSREAASDAFVHQAFEYYNQDNLDYAMRRYNQAWLLNPDNPEVYWGFASVLHDSGEYCEALNLLELGLSKGPIQPSYLPDYALLNAACGLEGENLSDQQKAEYFSKSDELFRQAESNTEIPRTYVYKMWVRSEIALENYRSAWDKVHKSEHYSKQPFDEYLRKTLEKRMPEP